jgi:hypothetical protein
VANTDHIDAACKVLIDLPLDCYGERARDILDEILVEKDRVMQFCAGEESWEPKEDQAAACRGDRSSDSFACGARRPTGPGRPQSDVWPRVQELVTELHLANPDRYGNEIALAVHAQLAKEFPGEAGIALSTLERRMKHLRDVARQSIDRQTRPEADIP